jgi:hypothetical protein
MHVSTYSLKLVTKFQKMFDVYLIFPEHNHHHDFNCQKNFTSFGFMAYAHTNKLSNECNLLHASNP